MKRAIFAAVCGLFLSTVSFAKVTDKFVIPTDSIRLSDPFVLADKDSGMYYMTGTGGKLWKSPDLNNWAGPFDVVETDPTSWMGPNPMIWAAEIHKHDGKYYYFATFTNREVVIDTVQGRRIERRACHILESASPEGPYRPVSDANYLPENMPTLDATLWIDKDGKPYMVYCHEWIQNDNGTVEKVELKPDFSGTTGERKLLFRASDSPWSRERFENGEVRANRVTDGPYLFRTATGRLGMIWTSWVYNVYTQGVAYSESGTLDGPWIQEKEPVTPPDFGHGMIFVDFKGRTLMTCHSHKDINGYYLRIPHFFEVDLSGNSIKVSGPIKP